MIAVFPTQSDPAPQKADLLPMNWDYVAAFFDGEGYAGIYRHRTGGPSRRWGVANTDLAVLQEIQAFIDAGTISMVGHSTGRQPRACYQLVVSRIDDLQRILPELLVRCRVKRPAIELLLADLEGRTSRPKDAPRTDGAAIRRLYWEEGLSIVEIGRRMGVSPSAIQRYMDRHNIPRRPPGPPPGPVDRLGPDELRRLYWEEGLSLAQIARQIGVHSVSVWAAFGRYGIPRRPQGSRAGRTQVLNQPKGD